MYSSTDLLEFREENKEPIPLPRRIVKTSIEFALSIEVTEETVNATALSFTEALNFFRS